MSNNELETIVETEPTTKNELEAQVQKIVKASQDNAGDIEDTVQDPVETISVVAAQSLSRLDRRVTEAQDAVRNLYEITKGLSVAINSMQTMMRNLQVQITQLNSKR